MTTTDPTTKTFEAEIAALRSDLAALRRDIAAVTRTAVQMTAETPDKIADSVRHKAEEVGERGAEIASSVGRHIEERPLASVAVAFGVGFLLANLFHRRAGNGVSSHPNSAGR
jgi:ElaB/YqjD/DUF883 family membrane-anchored ribosome-binding protein